MNTTLEPISPTRKRVIVSVPGSEIASEEKKLINNYARQAKVPGFRPGKAPANIIKARYKKEIADDLLGAVQRSAYQNAISENDLKVASVVETTDPTEISVGQDAELSFTLDVYPEFTLVEYKGLEAKGGSTDVVESEIEAAIEEIRNQRAEYNVVERPAENGDFVRLAYTGKIDGQPISEISENKMYSEQTSTWEEAGSETAPGVPAVVEGIIGLSAGDKSTVDYAFPEDFADDALKGKAAVYDLEVFEVREKKLPELDATLLESMEVESIDELREKVSGNIKQQKIHQNGNEVRRQIQDHLISAHDFEVPASLIEVERDSMLVEFMQKQTQRGVSHEELNNRREDLISEAETAAVNRVKLQNILSEIAEKEGIKVEQNDIGSVIYQEAMARRTTPDALVKELQKNRELLNEFQRMALFNKVLEFLVAEAKISSPDGESNTDSESDGDK
ncbi:MAG: trigger factor [Verrucomicrobiota bacterium]